MMIDPADQMRLNGALRAHRRALDDLQAEMEPERRQCLERSFGAVVSALSMTLMTTTPHEEGSHHDEDHGESGPSAR